ACGQRSPAAVVEGWMNSPGHRANILKAEFTHIGIGLAGGGRAGTYWTQLFGG
ncbi:CAP domain-containing protein, partial [Streptomyces sp. TRM76130]|nr:CAP domain-containing protein [Streptomyces sp. TRM76130]